MLFIGYSNEKEFVIINLAGSQKMHRTKTGLFTVRLAETQLSPSAYGGGC